VIFCPKYRRAILTGDVEKRLKEILLNVASKYEFEILEMEVMPDHVHLLVDCNPRFGIMECVKKMKSVSANTLRKEFTFLTTKMPNLWTRSAFISTVGTVSLETVKRYIENQKDK
jgi:putative transposase